ncbi:jg9891, partial [Pararge aegeria aegeria]
ALSSTESLSPPLPEGSRSAPALQRLRKFLSALQQFASDVGTETGDRVRQLIFNLVVTVTSGKDRRSPDQEEPRSSPTPGPPSPQNNGIAAALSSTESLSPPLPEGSRSAPALQRLRKFLSALQQFASDVGTETGDRVRQLIFNLV